LPDLEPDVQRKKPREEVDFRELPDGTLVETIADSNQTGKTKLAVFQNGEFRIEDQLVLADRTLVPLDSTIPSVQHIHFAEGIEDAVSAKELFEDTMALLMATVDVSVEHVCALSAWAIGTWFVQKFPVAPYLSFVGPPGSGKTTALRAMRLICWRALATADITSAAFYGISDKVGTTLLIDEAATLANRRQILHLMRAGSTPGFVTFRKNETFCSFGARAFSWTELPDDSALNSRSLIVPMKCSSRRDLLPVTHPPIAAHAQKLQRRLLHFRMSNYSAMSADRVAGEEDLQPRSRDLLRCLSAPFRKVPDVTEVLHHVFQNQESLREMVSAQQAATASAVYQASHEYSGGNWQVPFSSLKRVANNWLQSKNEPAIKSEKALGRLLTTLGFADRRTTNSGTVLILSRATRELVHALQRMHKIEIHIERDAASSCNLCKASKPDPAAGEKASPQK
jgi:hypothetical protein